MFLWLLLDFVIYFLLAIYLDNVLPSKRYLWNLTLIDEHGVSRPFYYFLTPGYWTGKTRPKGKNFKKNTKSEQVEIDKDVQAENDAVREKKLPKDTAVVIENLSKVQILST